MSEGRPSSTLRCGLRVRCGCAVGSPNGQAGASPLSPSAWSSALVWAARLGRLCPPCPLLALGAPSLAFRRATVRIVRAGARR